MSGYTCWKCGHPLVPKMFGGLQDCPNCRVVNAINKQTKAIQQASQPQQSSSPSQFSEAIWAVVIFGTIGYGIWHFFAYIFGVMWEYKWWSLLGLIIAGLITWGWLSDD